MDTLHHPSDVVSPSPLAQRLGRRWADHPFRAAGIVGVAGYVGLTLLLLAFGVLVINSPAIERWDDDVMARIAAATTSPLDTMAQWGSYLGETLVVIAIAAVSIAVMAWRKIWDGAGLLALGLLVEVTVFLTVSMTIDRPRPDVDQLDPAPPTGSYPSGHTAAAVVLYVTLALIAAARTTSRAVKVLCWILAIALPSTVGISRLVLGMHHPTDVAGSLVGALACMLIALLAVRTAVVAARDHRGPVQLDVTNEQPREAVRLMTAVGVVAHAQKSIDGGLEALRNALATEGVDDPMWEEVDKSRKVPKRIEKLVRSRRRPDLRVGRRRQRPARDRHRGGHLHDPRDRARRHREPARHQPPHPTGRASRRSRIEIRGADRPLDVGKMNGERFAVMAGAGLDAEMIERGRRHDEGSSRPPRLRAVRSPRALGPRPDPDHDRGGRRPVVRG